MSLADIRQSGAEHMEDEEVEQFLRDQGVGVLSLPDRDVPYVLPLSFGYDGDAHLYFTYLLFGEQSKKEDVSERAGRGRFLVYAAPSMYEWRSVLLTGAISEVPEDEWEELRTAMENAWHPDLFATAAPMRGIKGYRFRMTEQTSIKHSAKEISREQ